MKPESTKQYPDANGYFGEYGGAFLPPQLEPAFAEITEKCFEKLSRGDRKKHFSELLEKAEKAEKAEFERFFEEFNKKHKFSIFNIFK